MLKGKPETETEAENARKKKKARGQKYEERENKGSVLDKAAYVLLPCTGGTKKKRAPNLPLVFPSKKDNGR